MEEASLKKARTQSKKGKQLLPGKKQPFQWSRYSRSHFVNEAISNFDILNWIKCMKLKTFNKVLSGDEILKEKGFFVINLDDKAGAGTHWVAMNMKDVAIEYFGSLGLDCPEEFMMLSFRFNVHYVCNGTINKRK